MASKCLGLLPGQFFSPFSCWWNRSLRIQQRQKVLQLIYDVHQLEHYFIGTHTWHIHRHYCSYTTIQKQMLLQTESLKWRGDFFELWWDWLIPPALDFSLRPNLSELPVSSIVPLHHQINPFLRVPTNSDAEYTVFIYVNIGGDASRQPKYSHVLHIEHLLLPEENRALWQGSLLHGLHAQVYKGGSTLYFFHFLTENWCCTDFIYFPGACQFWWFRPLSLRERFDVNRGITAKKTCYSGRPSIISSLIYKKSDGSCAWKNSCRDMKVMLPNYKEADI